MMKKLLPCVIFIIILMMGLMAAFSYQTPETKAYTQLNTVDSMIEKNLEVQDLSIAQNLNELQATVKELITIGETYTDNTDMSSMFETFNTAYERSQTLQTQLTDLMSKDITSKLTSKTDKLSAEQKELTEQAISLEKNRLEKLNGLLTELETINSNLSKVEEMFYIKKPSDAIQYFNGITNDFKMIEEAYKMYANATNDYFLAKSNLYEAIIK